MSKEQKNISAPKLRFSEFKNSGAWEERVLDDIAVLLKGKGISKSDIKINGGQPCIRYGELYTHYQEVITSVVSFTDLPTDELILSESNDVIIPSSGETRNDIAKASCVLNKGIALGGDLNILRPKINGVFLAYYLTHAKKNSISKLAQGDAVVHLYANQLRKLTVSFPTLNKEQKKIASCLFSLDNLIATHTQELDALKVHKKGLMQQLFPVEGEKVPKLRFPDFRASEEWEQKTLGQSSGVLMCKRIFAEETNTNEGVPFFKIGTLGGKPDAYISRELFNEYKSKYNFPRKGEVLITCSGTVGKCFIYNGEDAYYQDSNIVWIDNPTLEVNNKLLYYILSDVNWNILNSTTITRIYGSDLRELKIVFPKSDVEQTKIVECLSSIDELIVNQTEKVQQLRQHKDGLMQGLFPSSNCINNTI